MASVRILKLVLIAVGIGVVSGLFSGLFLRSLDLVTHVRELHPKLFLLGLPYLGFIITRVPGHLKAGIPFFMKEIEEPKRTISFWMAPVTFLLSLGTHLFGGSAGREGVGVIMGVAGAQLVKEPKRNLTIYAGMAAGFASIFGTPWAALLFVFELNEFRYFRHWDFILGCALASFSSLLVPSLMGIKHFHFPVTFAWDLQLIAALALAGVCSGLAGLGFYLGMKSYARVMKNLVVAGVLVAVVIFLTDGYPYSGLGADVIARSFVEERSLKGFFMKSVLTILTVGAGFKGGEVTPLFFMGATLSNSVGAFLGLKNFALTSALGMVSLFGAVTATPFTSAILCAELFGFKVGLVSLASCLLARALMQKKSVYRL